VDLNVIYSKLKAVKLSRNIHGSAGK
jgi:hypothetical protein